MGSSLPTKGTMTSKYKESAEKRAAKLKKKYGEVALRKKAEKMERIKASHKMGGCTGSRVGCSSG
jgi:hypothetical protein